MNYSFVLMGVSGSGKSALAPLLASRLGAAVLDGDFLHPRANINKMSSGTPLEDSDRAPWLLALNDAIYAMARTNKISLIICSALKKSYRQTLRKGNENVYFLFLDAPYDVILTRLEARRGHFQKAGMLKSQFATLERPGKEEPYVITLDASLGLEEVAQNAQAAIARLIEG